MNTGRTPGTKHLRAIRKGGAWTGSEPHSPLTETPNHSKLFHCQRWNTEFSIDQRFDLRYSFLPLLLRYYTISYAQLSDHCDTSTSWLFEFRGGSIRENVVSNDFEIIARKKLERDGDWIISQEFYVLIVYITTSLDDERKKIAHSRDPSKRLNRTNCDSNTRWKD